MALSVMGTPNSVAIYHALGTYILFSTVQTTLISVGRLDGTVSSTAEESRRHTYSRAIFS
jgi:hypothetical protein